MKKPYASLDVATPSASTKRLVTKDTGAACHARAAADLVKSVAALTANQRRALERSAESWSLRAAMLERVEKSFVKRRALDEAAHEYEIQHARS